MLDFVACWPAMLLAFLQAFKGVVFAAKLKLSVNQRFTHFVDITRRSRKRSPVTQ